MPTQSRADVDLRRQVRLGHRHRVPRAQGQPALRHHAVADCALHDRHADGHQGPQQVRRRRSRGDRRGASTNGSSTTEQFHFYDEIDSNAGKTASGRLSVQPLADPRPGDRAVGRSTARRIARSTAWIRCGSWALDLLGHFGPRRRQGAVAAWQARTGERVDRVYDPDHRPYGLDLKHGAYLELDWMVTPLLGVSGAASCATRWSGWATPTAPPRRPTASTSPSPGAPSAAAGPSSTSTSW